ncbi:MAG TPA: hypothetical protein VLE51_02385 [Candidatus Saccharimonadales bacterium]|nr:hypothetical protein [Candidatus Saccharimonadales bacterium]
MEPVTYRPKIWLYTFPLWLIPVGIVWLTTKDSSITVLVLLVCLGFSGSLLSIWYAGVSINDGELSKKTIPRRKIHISEVDKLEYRKWWFENGFHINDPSWLVFVFEPDQTKLESYIEGRGFSIIRYGWLPSDRRKLFSQLRLMLEKQNIQMDGYTQQKLIKAASD